MLTAKQIEEARERLKTRVEYFCQAVEMEEVAKAAALDDIDALCAQAHLTAEVMADGDFAGHAAEDFDAAE